MWIELTSHGKEDGVSVPGEARKKEKRTCTVMLCMNMDCPPCPVGWDVTRLDRRTLLPAGT